jgi:trans-2,3-dihydro-3-hydroxyanthranilate isomerase
MRRAFHTLDVFTRTPLAGNPLAVVLDAKGLDTTRMQAIAREFNLAETVFVFEPKNPVNTASLRIFTPSRELPFAGHPTVGTAVLLAHLREPELLKSDDLRIVLEERVGEVVCVARHRKGQAMAA